MGGVSGSGEQDCGVPDGGLAVSDGFLPAAWAEAVSEPWLLGAVNVHVGTIVGFLYDLYKLEDNSGNLLPASPSLTLENDSRRLSRCW